VSVRALESRITRPAGRGPAPSETTALPFDHLAVKVRVPPARPGAVGRSRLVNRLRAAGPPPVAVIVAPVGYGKTTLLAQWAKKDARPVGWVTVDPRDNDPIVFLRHLGAALHGAGVARPSDLEPLRAPRSSIWCAAVPRLASALAAASEPLLLILDDAHHLCSDDSVEALSAIVEHVPDGSTLALGGRTRPRIATATLRAGGRLLELGAADLELSRGEAVSLLHGAGADVGDGEATDLVDQTEGWATGLQLAALARHEQAPFGGDHRYVVDFFRSELVPQLGPERMRFLRRTSGLEQLSGALCDAVLERRGSGHELEELAGEGLFVTPLDSRGLWFRLHPLFREFLRRELEQCEPELVRPLSGRAADWFERQGDAESAIAPAAIAGDLDRVARLVAVAGLAACSAGRLGAVEEWLDQFGGASLDRYPEVAVLGAWIHGLQGRAEASARWLAAAEAANPEAVMPDGSPSVSTWIAVVRAAMCEDGPAAMLADADAALLDLPARSSWRPPALLLRAVAHVLLGAEDAADAALGEAVEAARAQGAVDTQVVALSERAMLAERAGDARAEVLADESHHLLEGGLLAGYASSAIELASSARVLLRRGCWDEARADLATARRLTPFLTHAFPWLAAQTRLELARSHVALRDTEQAQVLLDEVSEVLDRSAGLGVLDDQAQVLQVEVAAARTATGVAGSRLTTAELRLLPLLMTHLSFREIGERLYLSRNTVKTQAISIYRKLAVSSRSEAIERAAGLGLLAAGAAGADFIPRG
jgi:LuxR family maltose regulon positive regulatory protein